MRATVQAAGRLRFENFGTGGMHVFLGGRGTGSAGIAPHTGTGARCFGSVLPVCYGRCSLPSQCHLAMAWLVVVWIRTSIVAIALSCAPGSMAR